MPELGGLQVVDGLALSPRLRRLLRPGQLVRGRDGLVRRLPRWFYEIPSWNVALETPLTPHYKLWEFLDVDVREDERLRVQGPRYVPLAVTLLAGALEAFRQEVDTYVHIAANGGYRSPAHKLAGPGSVHCWATAVNIYRVGDDWLDDERAITRYGDVARSVFPAFRALPYGHGVGETDDHLHLDVGFAVVAPHGGGDEMDAVPDEPDEQDATETGEG